MKIVINACFGGFGLSEEARELLADKVGKEAALEIGMFNHELRAAAALVAVVEELGERANGQYADLKVVEIPDDVVWEIHEYDGNEWVAEAHRTWS